MIKGINHIGIAVKNLEESMKKFQTIFSVDTFHQETVEEQKVRVASFNLNGILIELTAATDDSSPIAKFIEKRGEGIHHIAFESDEIQSDLTKLSNDGIELINKTPADGAHDMLIAFLHPKSTNGVLMELCQPKNTK